MRGATVTGVDISDAAISSARRLSKQTGIPAGFERADVYDWLEETARAGRRFDAVFSSYGVVCWLPDLDTWTRGIAAVLTGGGRFVLVDFHPATDMFDESWEHARAYPSGGERLLLKKVWATTSRNPRVVSRRRGLPKERVTSRTLITVTSSGGGSARSLRRWPRQD